MRISFLSSKPEGRRAAGRRSRAVPALTIGALVAATLVPLTVGQASAAHESAVPQPPRASTSPFCRVRSPPPSPNA